MTLPCFSEVAYQLAKSYPLPNLNHLLYHLPLFLVTSSQIKILKEPNEFYSELLRQCAKANHRITLSSLYIGTGKLEKKFVSLVSSRMLSEPNLRVRWLLDFTRASRNVVNSRTLLCPLIQQNPSTCEVSLYHTPQLRGFLKLLIPPRWNETVGLQHMKIYIFDNTVIISGANLSNDYFVNRQDRYIVINDCKPLSDFFDELVQIISTYSLQLTSDDKVTVRKDVTVHPFKGDHNKYCKEVTASVKKFWDLHIEKSKLRLADLYGNNEIQSKEFNTMIFPTIQMPPFGIRYDSQVTHEMLVRAFQGTRIHLASGYFNLTNRYITSILLESRASYNIVCAHPKANGFFGASGFAGGIPAAYTNLSKHLYEKVLKLGLKDRITISEYIRDGWTFHAKGLWYFLPGTTFPILTMIGSPNFGYRSVYRDLESQLVVATCCPTLMKEMADEQEQLYSYSQAVSKDTFRCPERKVPLWVKLFTFFMKHYF